MDLSTTYLGMKLKNPVVPSASPLSRDLDNIRWMEDAGAGALVMYSLFQEQITNDAMEMYYHTTQGSESYFEALNYFTQVHSYNHGPESYLEQLRKAKEAVHIPVIASLNGTSLGGWLDYAKKIEATGVDALELNIYNVAADPSVTGADIETQYLEIVKTLKQIGIPIAVKLSPFFTSTANIAKRLDEAGANGLVLFNRFYQPDIDLEDLEIVPNVILSSPFAMRLPMRWIAILHKRVSCSLAATGGIHTAKDVLKMMMAGADVAMVCSVLLKHGIHRIREILEQMETWMAEHDYDSIAQMQGSMSQISCGNPSDFERVHYMKALTGYHA